MRQTAIFASLIVMMATPAMSWAAEPSPATAGAEENSDQLIQEINQLSDSDRAALIDSFMIGSVRFVVFHELGHFLIDEYDIPVLGREEDAADRYAAYTLAATTPPAEMVASITLWLALGYLGEHERDKIAWWDEHSIEEQRAFQLACLIAGMLPDRFANLPTELGAPAERAQMCGREADNNARAWQVSLVQQEGVILDLQKATISYELAPPEFADDKTWLEGTHLLDGVGREIARYKLPQYRIELRDEERKKEYDRLTNPDAQPVNDARLNPEIKLVAQSCEKANAYYDNGLRVGIFSIFSKPAPREAPQIVVCYELIDQFRMIANAIFAPSASPATPGEETTPSQEPKPQ